MAANENKLSDLHNKVAEVLSKSLDGKTIVDEDGAEIHFEPSAAMVSNAIKFLKDNNVTSTPSDDNALGEVRKKMQERQRKRALQAADLQSASDQMGFLTGLPTQ